MINNNLNYFGSYQRAINIPIIGKLIYFVSNASVIFIMLTYVPFAFAFFLIGYVIQYHAFSDIVLCLFLALISLNIKGSLLLLLDRCFHLKKIYTDVTQVFSKVSFQKKDLSSYLELLQCSISKEYNSKDITSEKPIFTTYKQNSTERVKVFELKENSGAEFIGGHAHYSSFLGSSSIFTTTSSFEKPGITRFIALHELGHTSTNGNLLGLLRLGISPVYLLFLSLPVLMYGTEESIQYYIIGVAALLLAYLIIRIRSTKLVEEKCADIFSVANSDEKTLQIISKLMDKYPRFLYDKGLSEAQNHNRRTYLLQLIKCQLSKQDQFRKHYDREQIETTLPFYMQWSIALFIAISGYTFVMSGFYLGEMYYVVALIMLALVLMSVVIAGVVAVRYEAIIMENCNHEQSPVQLGDTYGGAQIKSKNDTNS